MGLMLRLVIPSKANANIFFSGGGINFYDATGRVLLKDKDYGTQFTPFDDAGTFSYNVRQAFLLDKDEVIYGLGQQQTGKVNQRNQKLFLRRSEERRVGKEC